MLHGPPDFMHASAANRRSERIAGAARHAWHDFLEQAQTARRVIVQIIRQTGHVPAGPRQARDDPAADRVADLDHYIGIVLVACFAACAGSSLIGRQVTF